MSDVLSFAELEGQHAELLPARTVLSLLNVSARPSRGCSIGNLSFFGGNQTNIADAGGCNIGNQNYGGNQFNSAGAGFRGR